MYEYTLELDIHIHLFVWTNVETNLEILTFMSNNYSKPHVN